MRFTVHTTMPDPSLIADMTNKAAHAVAEQIKSDTEPFVPMRNGYLKNQTKVVGNTVVYPDPYARFLYYGKVMVDPQTGSPWASAGATKVVTDRDLVFTTDFHPRAQSHWFEASKAENLDKWVRVAQKAVDKYG